MGRFINNEKINVKTVTRWMLTRLRSGIASLVSQARIFSLFDIRRVEIDAVTH